MIGSRNDRFIDILTGAGHGCGVTGGHAAAPLHRVPRLALYEGFYVEENRSRARFVAQVGWAMLLASRGAEGCWCPLTLGVSTSGSLDGRI